MKAFVLFLMIAVAAISSSAQEKSVEFRQLVEKRLRDGNTTLAEVCPIDRNIVARRVFKDYGAMFIADRSVKSPWKCIFSDEEEVSRFQATVRSSTRSIGGVSVTLQEAAMKSLDEAIAEAARAGLKVTPRGGSASKRSFADTARIWNSRFEPALKHWTSRGRITTDEAEMVRRMNVIDQVTQVIRWEERSIWFSTGFNRSIFSSVAAPGTSQHLSMIALDVTEFGNTKVRAILNKHGWFQTIIDDTPHFTYLGHDEKDLPRYGLTPVERDGFKFWIPNFDR